MSLLPNPHPIPQEKLLQDFRPCLGSNLVLQHTSLVSIPRDHRHKNSTGINKSEYEEAQRVFIDFLLDICGNSFDCVCFNRCKYISIFCNIFLQIMHIFVIIRERRIYFFDYSLTVINFCLENYYVRNYAEQLINQLI